MWKTPRTLLVAGTALVAGLGVGAAVVPAMAAQDPVLTQEQQSTLQSQIDAFKSCLQEQGVTLPEKPADGSRPQLTDEQKSAMRAAHEECEGSRPSRPELSAEQQATLQSQMQEHRACMEAELSAAGITKPEKPADGSRPERPQLTDEQKAAFAAARTACEDVRPNLGVEGGGPMGGHGLRGLGGPGGRGGPGGPGGPGSATQGTTTAV